MIRSLSWPYVFIIYGPSLLTHSQSSIDEPVLKGFKSRWLRLSILGRVIPLYMVIASALVGLLEPLVLSVFRISSLVIG